MIIPGDSSVHLTYCLNVHSGETWEENFSAIRDKAVQVRDLVNHTGTFGLGLRLSNTAADQLRGDGVKRFRNFLDRENMYAFTVNGFPFGLFHGARVKEDVYKPDWRESARVDYTNRLADILAELLPEGVAGSISTVPCAYKSSVSDPADVDLMVENLMECVVHLSELAGAGNSEIVLGLEPEPDCFLETTQEVIDFFQTQVMVRGLNCLAGKGYDAESAESMIRRHLGVCFDTCHSALQFEDPCQSLRNIIENDIRFAKIQISAALAMPLTGSRPVELEPFFDDVYLHQTRIKAPNGSVMSFRDLSDKVLDKALDIKDGELRTHFHLPLYYEGTGSIRSTASLLSPEFFGVVRDEKITQLEIETYTFDVLPDDLKSQGVVASVAKEYDWVLSRIM